MATFLAMFLLTLPLVMAVGNDDPANLPQTIWLQTAVPLFWVAGFAAEKPRRSLPALPFFVPVGAFLVWSALSALWATDPSASARVLLPWIAAAGLAFLIAGVLESPIQARRLLLSLFWGSVVVSGIGLVQSLGGWDGLPQAFPPAGTMGNKNIAAAFVATMAPVGVAAFAAAGAATLGIAISLGMAMAFVLHTGCRAAALALAVQLVAAHFFLPVRDTASRLTRTKWGALCAGMAVFLGLSAMAPASLAPAQPSFAELLPANPQPGQSGAPLVPRLEAAPVSPLFPGDRSVAIRLGVWKNTLEMIRTTPASGVGLGNFQANYPRFATNSPDQTLIEERVESAHNDYLQMTAELGFIGVGLLGWVALVTLQTAVAAYRAASSEDQPFHLAMALGFLGLLVLGSASPTVSQPVSLAVTATFVGVVLNARTLAGAARSTGTAHQEARGRYRALSFAGAAAVLVGVSWWGLAQIRADRHVFRMGQAEARGDWPAVVREGLAARSLNPGRAGTRFGTASAMLRLGQTKEAAGLLEELAAVDPYNANALGNLGIAYATLGDLRQAAACFERVLLLRPDDRFARDELRRIRARTRVARGEEFQ